MPPNQNQTSFIPRKPVSDSGGKKSKRPRTGFFFIGSLAILIVTGVTAAGVYFYQQYLNSHLQAQQEDLSQAQEAFEPDVILELQRFSDRITAARELSGSHLAMSELFATLNEHTLETVRFTDFNVRQTDTGFELTLSGAAESYSSVALQSDAFGEVSEFRNPIFSDITVAQDGRITFAVVTTIAGDAFTYDDTLTNASQ